MNPRALRYAHIERLPFTRNDDADVCLAVPVNDNGPSRLFFAEKDRLSRFSRFFAAMFGHTWREQRLSSDGKPVTLTDVSADVFHSLLHFMYTQHLVAPKLSLTPLALFWLLQHYANYYQISGLEEAASSLLVADYVTPSSVFSIWRESLEIESKKLRNACLNYFIAHFSDCAATSEFLSCPKELMYEALRAGRVEMSFDSLSSALHIWGRCTLHKDDREVNSRSLALFLQDFMPPNVLFNVEHKRNVLSDSFFG